MFRCFFLLFLLFLTEQVSFADQAAWNCQQSKESKEWVCVGDKKSPETSDQGSNPDSPAKIKEQQPVPAVEKISKPPVEPSEPKQAENLQSEQDKQQEPKKAVEAEVETEAETPVEAAKVEQAEAQVAEKKAPPVSTKPEYSLPAPVTVTNSSKEGITPGWTCGADQKEGNWDCKLVGADPKGRAQIAKDDTQSFSLLTPAFDYGQEQTFNTLTSQLKYDPWENCSVQIGPGRQTQSSKDLRTTSPLDVKSDYSEIFDNEIGTYFGNVEMNRGDQHSVSHTANYDAVSETLDLQGGVYYSEEELALFSDTATLKLGSDQAKLRDTLFIAPATPLRGRAKVVYRDNKSLSRYKQVAYTSCKPGNQDWVMHASELKINRATGKGAAKNAWLEAKGLPVFYLPYISFPIDNRRLSGFLAPSYNYTETSGYSVNVPYYWNIAPNYDFTFNPKYFDKRGVLLGGNFRYLFEQTKGNLGFEVLPYDSIRDRSRFLGSFKNNTIFTDHITSNIDLNYVSDKDYFSELGNALSFSNFSYIRSSADLNYIREGASLTGRFDNYQSVDPTLSGISLPYKRLPQVNLNLNHSFKFMPLDTAVDTEYVFFQHNSLVNGQRLNIKPSVSIPFQTASAYLTPKMSLQHTQYELTDQNPGIPSSISRTLPIFSVDSGLFFERDLNFGQSALVHTLEPRLFYLYIPKKDQSDIPLFDSSLYDFWYSSMFRENRFSGSDRIQDANQITAALTSRIVDPVTGRERLRLNIGEIMYFRDREVTAPFFTTEIQNGSQRVVQNESPIETNTFSNLVAELSSELTDHVAVETGIQWNPHSNDVERGKAALHFSNQPDEIFNVGYFYRKNPLVPNRANDIIQSDVSFRWPIYDDWYAVGRWQYSLLYNRTQESFLGLEKENCCWRFRVIGRHFINGLINTDINSNVAQAVQGTAQTGVFFQVELKGLTGIGQKLDEFFEQNIYGYRKPEK